MVSIGMSKEAKLLLERKKSAIINQMNSTFLQLFTKYNLKRCRKQRLRGSSGPQIRAESQTKPEQKLREGGRRGGGGGERQIWDFSFGLSDAGRRNVDAVKNEKHTPAPSDLKAVLTAAAAALVCKNQ